MKNRRTIHWIFPLLLGALLWMVGCSKEVDTDSVSDAKTVSLQIKVSSLSPSAETQNLPAGTTGQVRLMQEEMVGRVRMILFSCDASGVVTSLIANQLNVGMSPFVQRITPGYVRIILVANELDSWSLQNITSMAQLNALQFANDLLPTTTPPFTMYSDSVVNVTETQNTFTIPLVRTVAKVTLNLKCSYADLGESITLKSVTIRNLPKVSYLVTQPYNGSTGFYAGTAVAMDYASGNVIYTADELKTKAGGVVFYIPEYQAANVGTYMYLDIVAAPTNNPSRTLRYRIVLGNGAYKLYTTPPASIESLTAQDLSITRNNNYILNATIRTLDQVDLAVKMTVADWTVDNSTNGWMVPPYINVSLQTMNFDRAKPFRVYFWTNQETAVVVNELYVHDPTGARLTTVAGTLVGLPAGENFYFNPATGMGYIDIVVKSQTAIPLKLNDVLWFTFKAGNLRRSLQFKYIK
ncbi:MAG: hypothetical protein RR330_07340 [Alistipes sp.]